MTLARLVSLTLASSFMLATSACGEANGDDTGVATPAPAPEFTIDDVNAAPDDWRRVDPENLLIFETTKGRILIEMLPEAAPEHVVQFRTIAESGLYDGTIFHRVIDDFMAQGGDIFAVNGKGSGLDDLKGQFTFRRVPANTPINPKGDAGGATQGLHKGFPIATQAGYLAEMTMDGAVDSWIPHCPGVVSTARTDDPNSANSQFFLMRHQADHLDKKYTAWGRVIDGFHVVRAIKKGPEPNGTPIDNPDRLEKAYMATQLPEDERPVAYVQNSDIQLWSDRLAAAAQLKTDICDIPQVPAVIDE